MLPAITLQEIKEWLQRSDEKIMMIGLLFARPQTPLARSEIIPHLDYFHYRSGNYIHFFCGGYGAYWGEDTYPDQEQVVKINGTQWYFSPSKFNYLRKEVEEKTNWRYSGGVDLVLLTINEDEKGKPILNFNQSFSFPLEKLKNDGVIYGVEIFFEEIFRFAEDYTGDHALRDFLRSSYIVQKFQPSLGPKIFQQPFNLTTILFLAADPSNASRRRLGEEFREIQEKLKLSKFRDNFRVELPQLSMRPPDISQAMLDLEPQIVHFSGHGTSTGALCFENKAGEMHLVQPSALAALFKQFSGQVKCVLLNACYSETQARAIAKHIKFVIGMNQAIGNEAAIAFTIGFYQALGAGRTIEEAYQFGCVQIQLQSIPEHLTPVLLKNEHDPAVPKKVKLDITPVERLESNCPHISVVVKNRENKMIFCKVESHSIYDSSGEDIKRRISSYANHFSWAGGSDRGTKEIPPNLDGVINIAKVNKRGYGIAFLFDENPTSFWDTEGTYKLDLKIVGIIGEDSSGLVTQRVIVEFEYIKNEAQNTIGELINNSELKLLTWSLIDTS
ncbi:MAG: CHAT domain-containing protein [Anaerolineae bacterium]|nr:CHAT domain-containing protein [Anaerolineae bacterium]